MHRSSHENAHRLWLVMGWLVGCTLTSLTPAVSRAAETQGESPRSARLEVWYLQLRPPEAEAAKTGEERLAAGRVMTVEQWKTALGRLHEANRVAESTVFQVGAVHDSPVSVQLERSTPRITGVTRGGGKVVASNTQQVVSGTQIEIHPKWQDAGSVRLDLELTGSSLGDADVVLYEPDEGEPIHGTALETLELRTGLDVPWDAVVCALGVRAEGGASEHASLVLIRVARTESGE